MQAKEEAKAQKAQMQDKFKFLDLKKGGPGHSQGGAVYNEHSPNSRKVARKPATSSKAGGGTNSPRNSHSNFASSQGSGRRKNSANKSKKDPVGKWNWKATEGTTVGEV